ncbi:MAG: glycosyltransferase family 9 protein, partial [bacterium]|nr:glycosyltransferase family 9 protein [Candidatus Kapabacteria bacterium]
MSIARRLESINRRVMYAVLRGVLRNREVASPIDATNVRSVLILRHDAIGDMVVTTAAIDLLKRRIPGVAVDVIASTRNAGVIRNDPRVRGVHIYRKGVSEIVRLSRELRGNNYDIIFAFVLSKTTEAGLLANAIGGQRAIKVAVRNDDRAHLYSTFFNLQVSAPRFTRSMAEILAGVVADSFGWSLQQSDVRMSLHLSDAHRAHARRFHDAQPQLPFVAVNISSGNDYRKWSFERNEAFVRAVLARHPELRVVVVSSPDDYDEACRLIPLDSARVAIAPMTQDILDVAAILEGALIVVSPDTSIIHIASAIGAPALTLYSQIASHYTEWMPFGVPFEAVITMGKVPIDSLEVAVVMEAFESLYVKVGGVRV